MFKYYLSSLYNYKIHEGEDCIARVISKLLKITLDTLKPSYA